MSVIRIGIDLPWLGSTWPVGASISPSILLALSDLSSSPLLPSHTIEFAWLDSRCDATAGSDVTAEFLAGYDVDVLIGSACSAVALELGDAMTEAAAAGSPFKAIPHISYGAAAPELGDKTSFPHFSRMVADYSGYAAALLALSEKLGWGSIAVLHNSDSLYAETAAVLESAFAGSATSAALHPFSSSSAASSFLSGEGAGADAVVLLGYCPDVVDWLGLADSLGLRASSRPFLHADVTQACLDVAAPDAPVDLAGTWGMKSPAPDPDSPLMVRLTNLAAAAALPPAFDFGNFMSFPYGTIDPGDAAAAFEASMAEETRSYATSEPDSTYAPYLYDAIMLYATAMDRLMSDMGHDFFAEGETIPLNMANMYIRGTVLDSAASGHVVLDENGNRKTDIDVVYIEGGAVGDPTTFEESAAGTFRASTSGDVELLDGYLEMMSGPEEEIVVTNPPAASSSSTPLVAGIGAGAVLVLAALFYFSTKRKHDGGKDKNKVMPGASTIKKQASELDKLKHKLEEVQEDKAKLGVSNRELTKDKEELEKTKNKMSDQLQEIQEKQKMEIQDGMRLDMNKLKFLEGTKNTDTRQNISILGKGSFAVVYAGTYLGTPVAVKEVDKGIFEGDAESKTLDEVEACDSITQEVNFIQKVRHPHIITCVGLADMASETATKLGGKSRLLIVMEMAKKGSMRDLLKRHLKQMNEVKEGLDGETEGEGSNVNLSAATQLHSSTGRGKMRKLSNINEVMTATLKGEQAQKFVNMLYEKDVEERDAEDDDGWDTMSEGQDEEEEMAHFDEREEIDYLMKTDWLQQIATAMEYVHGRNIIYRDLKADNVLVTGNYAAKLTDFGTSLQVPEGEEDVRSWGRVGTILFMAPEVFVEGEYGFKADVYSFGMLLLEIVCHGELLKKFKEVSWTSKNDEGLEMPMGKCKSALAIAKRMASGAKPDFLAFFEGAGFQFDEEMRMVELVEGCFELDQKKRPTFKQVKEALDGSSMTTRYAGYSRRKDSKRGKGKRKPKQLLKKVESGETPEATPSNTYQSDVPAVGKATPESTPGNTYQGDVPKPGL